MHESINEDNQHIPIKKSSSNEHKILKNYDFIKRGREGCEKR